jgi:hypothetical protein
VTCGGVLLGFSKGRDIYSQARILLSKMIAFISLMDDTYAAHATFERSAKRFSEAIQGNFFNGLLNICY